MINKYIATFFSHFGAISYFKTIKEQGISAKLMPVPRKVSSSCGTCVYYENFDIIDTEINELECIYLENNNTFECVLKK